MSHIFDVVFPSSHPLFRRKVDFSSRAAVLSESRRLEAAELQVAEMKMLSFSLEGTRKNMIRRARTSEEWCTFDALGFEAREARLWWFGCVHGGTVTIWMDGGGGWDWHAGGHGGEQGVEF